MVNKNHLTMRLLGCKLAKEGLSSSTGRANVQFRMARALGWSILAVEAPRPAKNASLASAGSPEALRNLRLGLGQSGSALDQNFACSSIPGTGLAREFGASNWQRVSLLSLWKFPDKLDRYFPATAIFLAVSRVFRRESSFEYSRLPAFSWQKQGIQAETRSH
jgi:hypothetical protein